MNLTLEMFNWQISKLKSDKQVIRSAKQLYRDLYNLSKEKGYCFATNRYLAEEYAVAKETISRWVSSLKKFGYIDIEEIRDKYKRVIERRIYILKPKDMDFSRDEIKSENENSFKSSIGIDENVKDNKELLPLKQEEENKINVSNQILNAFELLNTSITPNEKNILSIFEKKHGTELVLYAIERSAHADCKIAYIRTLLADWKSKNIKSTAELIKKFNLFSPKQSFKYPKKVIRKELVPEWLNKPYESSKSTDLNEDDQQKINRMKELQEQLLNFNI